jgi:uncharacterized protein
VRVLFDIAHPAHVHLFRNLVKRVRAEGGEVLVATRRKDVTVELCEAYGIPQVVLSRARPGGYLTLASELVRRTSLLLFAARRFRPDALVGTSVSVGPVARLLRRPSFVFAEDDAAIVPLFARVVYPVCHWIATPEALRHEAHGRKHLTYRGYHELAYLHPEHFTPDPAVPRSLGIGSDSPYFVVRFVELKGHHDSGASGLSLARARELVALLVRRGRVLITSEAVLPEDLAALRLPLPPHKLHDVLAFASLYVGDSQTMAMEAAVLGVPGIRCNSFVGRISVLRELEERYGLARGIRPEQGELVIETARQWLDAGPSLRAEYQQRRRRMLSECVNLAEWQWQMLNEKIGRP